MRTRTFQKARNGFTLIELIIVVIVLAILLGLAIPSFLGAQDGANEVAAKGNLSTGYKAAKLGAAANGNRFDTGATLLSKIGDGEPELKFSSGSAPDACNLVDNAVMVGSDSTATYITMYARVGAHKTLRLTASATTSPQFSESACGTTPSVGDATFTYSGGDALWPGVTVTANATVTGMTDPTVTYQWIRETQVFFPDFHLDFTPIPGATSASYLVTAADYTAGTTLDVVVTATDAGGTIDGARTSAGDVGNGGPRRLAGSFPTLSENATVGDTMTIHPGTYTGIAPISAQYAWLRCPAPSYYPTGAYGFCSTIVQPYSSSTTYEVQPADAGSYIVVKAMANGRNFTGNNASFGPTIVIGNLIP